MTKKLYCLSLLVTLLAVPFIINGGSTLSPVAALAEGADVVPLRNIVQIAASGVETFLYSGSHVYSEHTCALTTSGRVKCWGHSGSSRTGDTTDVKEPPMSVSGLSNDVVAITVGAYHTCALTTHGGVLCWGQNFYGQLGNGGNFAESPPVSVSGLSSGVTAIAANGAQTCALTVDGSVLCWGATVIIPPSPNPFWQATPVPVNGLGNDIAAITVSHSESNGHFWNSGYLCALTIYGAAKCWGENYFGQLGDSTTTYSNIPVDVHGLGSGVVALAAGEYHTCALMINGGVECWGSNNVGQLGNDISVKNSSVPLRVQGLSGRVTAIAAGSNHTCAVMTSGGVECWGANAYGQLGNGTTAEAQSAPSSVSDLSGVASVAAGARHSCALTTTGTVKCWGYDISGQLGDGSAWSTTPVDVMEEPGVEPPLATPTFIPTAINTPPNTSTNTPTPVVTETPFSTPAPGTPTSEPAAVTVRIEGKVFDPDTQKGIPDMLMNLSGTGEGVARAIDLSPTSAALLTSTTVYTATTDLNGVFVFPRVKFGTYNLTGVKDGRVLVAPAPLAVNAGGTLQLPPLPITKVNTLLYLPLVTK